MSELEINIEKNTDISSIPWLNNFKFRPYRHIAGFIDEENLSAHFLKDLKKFVNTENHFLLVARENGDVKGLCAFLVSQWDSELFGFNYGTVKYIIADGDYFTSFDIKRDLLQYLHNHCKKENIAFLHSRVDLEDISSIHALESNRFNFISMVVRHTVLSGQVKCLKRNSPNVFLSQDNDVNQLKMFSKFIFTDNRFHLDPRFDREKVQSLYSSWVENSCKGQVQDKVFVYRQNNKVAGFATCGLRKSDSESLSRKIGAIDLVGIDPKFQHKGIAVKLVQSSMEWLKENVDLTEAVMAANNSAMIKILEKFGFSLKNIQMDFHCWVK